MGMATPVQLDERVRFVGSDTRGRIACIDAEEKTCRVVSDADWERSDFSRMSAPFKWTDVIYLADNE